MVGHERSLPILRCHVVTCGNLVGNKLGKIESYLIESNYLSLYRYYGGPAKIFKVQKLRININL